MPSDPFAARRAIDVGLLSPGTAGADELVSDAAVVDALVAAEVALVRAHAAAGVVAPEVADAVSRALGWREDGDGCRDHGIDPGVLAARATSGGNPVIPLVPLLRDRVPETARSWIHRGATSQDILDTALALLARDAVAAIVADLDRVLAALGGFAVDNRDIVAAARTLTQHAVPTTVGARAAGWVRGIRRSHVRLRDAAGRLPAQLGGAAGTLAAWTDEFGADTAAALPGAFAAELGLRAPEAPWHTERWPITELGDALVQTLDALGKTAADVATLSRTEIGELAEARGGGSSAMPQKRNPVDAVLIRAAAVRAPHLGAALHAAAGLAVDERPDGAWHAEWPTLRELLRIVAGAAAHATTLAEGLRVDRAAVARNVALSGGAIVSERLARILEPRIGRRRFDALLAATAEGSLADAVRGLPEAADLDVDALLDPAGYTGLAVRFADTAGKDPS